MEEFFRIRIILRGALLLRRRFLSLDMRISIHLMFVSANDTIDAARGVGKRVSDIRALRQEKPNEMYYIASGSSS